MNAITKSLDSHRALVNTVHARAMQLKQPGMAQSMDSSSSLFAPDSWQQQARSREAFNQFRSWVYAAVNKLASEAASRPVSVGQITRQPQEPVEETDQKRRRTKGMGQFLRTKMTDVMQRKSAGKDLELLPDHPLMELMEQPNPIQTRSQFVYTLVSGLNLTGRAYIVRDKSGGKDGRPQFWALPSSWVRPDHKEGPYSKFFVTNPNTPELPNDKDALGPDQVAMLYLPNPADPMSCISPASSQAAAIRVDDRIQTCKEKHFDNGILPTMVVTVGKNPLGDNVGGGLRPRLSAQQRHQIEAAISKSMGGVANYGKPAIVDGLIESITPVSRGATELGWDQSEVSIKTRILSAFCVHPFLLGEPLGVGGYSQSYNILKVFCDRLNTFLDMISLAMTYLANIAYGNKEDDSRLLVWWEKAAPTDPSLELSTWRAGRDAGDITRDEWRAKLGLAPDERQAEEMIPPRLQPTVPMLLQSVGMGQVQPQSATAFLRYSGVPAEVAEEIVGSTAPPEPTEGDLLGGLMDAVASLREPLQLGVESILEKTR